MSVIAPSCREIWKVQRKRDSNSTKNNPESPIIKALQHQKRDAFYEIDLKTSCGAKMPPFSRLIALIICGKNQIETQKAASEIARSFHNKCLKEFEILGPSPAAINFLNNKYRYRILLKIHNKHSLSMQRNLKRWIKSCNLSSSIAITIDVDPVIFLTDLLQNVNLKLDNIHRNSHKLH